MSEIISKELLSDVLKGEIEIEYFENITINKNNILISFAKYDKTGITGTFWGFNINIYELAFRTREYLKTKSKHLSLNQSIDDIFKEANDIYESLSK